MNVLRYFHFTYEIWGALFCLVACVVVFMTRKFDKKGAFRLMSLMFCSALLMVSDALAWWFRGDPSDVGGVVVKIAVFCAFMFGFLVMPLTAEYVSHIVSVRSGIKGLIWKHIEWALFGIGVIMLTVNVFYRFMYSFDASNTYFRLDFGFVPGLLALIGIAITLGVVFEYIKSLNKYERVAVILFLVLPIIGTLLQTLYYGLSLSYLSLVISAFVMFFSYIRNYIDFNTQKEKLLTEERIRLFNHQIQPHFIFNSLSVIRHLIGKSQDEAIDALNEFSGYLRGCTDFLKDVDTIPVNREIDLVKHYLYMEKKRFGESVNVKFDIEDTLFEVPPFAILTFVENSLTHGLRASRVVNGTIVISTKLTGGNHVITVADNGIGFDSESLEYSSEEHVGIKNTEQRLQLMCDGSVYIDSKEGVGTSVTIYIPAGKKAKGK